MLSTYRRRPRRTYDPPSSIYIEDPEHYAPGGLHPISIGDSFSNNRYKVLHKLGFGGSSTVWLARDRNTLLGGLVTLKVLRADVSMTSPRDLGDVTVPQLLHTRATHHPGLQSIQTTLDHFLIDGPNGSHTAIVHPFAALTVSAMCTLPANRWLGARRLRSDLARRVAKQAATALQCMHDTGVVHGDISVSNILFRASDEVQRWSDAEVYAHLGKPVEELIYRLDDGPVAPHGPRAAIESVNDTRLQDPQLIRPEIFLSDFDRSYELSKRPEDYIPGTAVNYCPPELHFDHQAGLEADIWCLGCAIFHIRAGFPLFSDFWGDPDVQLRMMVETLGRLPDTWWTRYESRYQYFEEDGSPKNPEERKLAGGMDWDAESSIRDKLRSIGVNDTTVEDDPGLPPPVWDQGPMCEKVGVILSEDEVALLGDLLEKMLVYRPADRLTIAQVLEHPWLAMYSNDTE